MAPFTSPLAEDLAEDALDRFLRYARVDTQSARDRDTTPSTECQLDLSRMLLAELRELGLEDCEIFDTGYVFATLPGEGPVIGVIAHVDVSPDAPGSGVEPIVHRDYDGGVIELPRGGTRLDPATVDHLAGKAGGDIVTSSGDTLLRPDAKAGRARRPGAEARGAVAEIMAAVPSLAGPPELPRPTLRVGFTVDEEIGQGAIHFD